MKLLARFFTLTALLFIVACGSDDDPQPEPTREEKHAGRWNLTDIDASGVINFAGQSIPFVTTDAQIDPGSYFDFQTNPQEVDYDASATITISAGQEFDVPYQRSGQGVWEFKGADSLIVTEQGQTTRYFILNSTDTRMILRSIQTLSLSGQTATATVEAVIER